MPGHLPDGADPRPRRSRPCWARTPTSCGSCSSPSDPERDTPEILRAYTQAFDPGFIGLRGTAEQTRAAAQSLQGLLSEGPTGSSYTMDHTALTYIIDAQGKLRLALRHQQSAQECAQDLRTVL